MAESKTKRRWTREETLAALSLYTQTPFGKMGPNNSDVQELAKRFDRTTSSIALKLANFASLDPEHQERGMSGMSHVSKLDQEVWRDFYGKWDQLAEVGIPIESREDTTEIGFVETESLATVRIRRGQQFFRQTVLSAYANRCCITGISSSNLIRASHIIPWATQTHTRLDPQNGLALNALHDAAFDKGLIAFDDACQLLLSDHLRDCIPESVFAIFFAQYEGKRIKMPDRFAPRIEYLRHHRDRVFSG